MRGFPLLQSLFLSLFLALIGIGFSLLLDEKDPKERLLEPLSESNKEAVKPAKIQLIFSHSTEAFELRAGDLALNFHSETSNHFQSHADLKSGLALFLKVTPASIPPIQGPFFVKLIVEAEGEKTFTHIFDAEGAIDDFIELPF